MTLRTIVFVLVLAALLPAGRAQMCGAGSWVQVAPSDRSSAAMAYDPDRGGMIIFGGWAGFKRLGDTWFWDGARWAQLDAPGPTPSASADLVWDSARRRLLLYNPDDPAESRTWVLREAVWEPVVGAGGPDEIYGDSALAYDSQRDRVVLHFTQETWEFDGSVWERIAGPQPAQGDRYDFGMGYDAARQRVVLYGGMYGEEEELGDTWEYDGTGWTLRSPGPGYGSAGARLVFDTQRGQLLRVGGYGYTSHAGGLWGYGSLVFAWDGVEWTEVGEGYSGRAGLAATFDNVRNRLVLYGGVYYYDYAGGDDRTYYGDIREWGGVEWLQVTAAREVGVLHYAMAFDGNRGHTVIFGGNTPSAYVSGPYAIDRFAEWLGATTSDIDADPRPSRRTRTAMAYDKLRRQLVLFAGDGDPLLLSDTWTFDGLSWSLRTPAVAPPGRLDHAMAYLPTAGAVILFGGRASDDETWSWNGSNWTRLAVAGPTSRYGHDMAYDERRNELLLVGGERGGVGLTDTWAFDGSAWRMVSAAGPGGAEVSLFFVDTLGTMGALTSSGQLFVLRGDDWDVMTQRSGGGFRAEYDRARQRVFINDALDNVYEWTPPCLADCDCDGELTLFDFLCFQNQFAAGDIAADCDFSGSLDFFDFLCFQNHFHAGCP